MDTRSYSLISAVREGRLERVRELFSSFGPSYLQAEGYFLLCDAVENNHTAVTDLLLTSGSEVDSKNKKPSNTPLYFAVINGNIEIVKMLLNKGANIDAINEYGKTPLHNAIKNEKMEVTELLLKYRADVNARDNEDQTPLNVAAKRGCLQIVELLLYHDADINAIDKYGRTALHFTAFSKGTDIIKEEIAKLLLCRGANVDTQDTNGVTTLHIATEKGYVKVVEALLGYNANVNLSATTDYITPLHLSAEKGYKEISEMLLEKGANVNAEKKDGMTALHIAIQNGHKKVVEALLKYGAKVDSKGSIPPLHIAAQNGFSKEYQEIVKILLKFGADIHSRDKDDRTALHIASEVGAVVIVQTLLEYGSDINIVSKSNSTPLGSASESADIRTSDDIVNDQYDSDSVSDVDSEFDHGFEYDYNYDSDRGCSANEAIVQICVQHIIKMQTANLYVSRENLLLISSNDGISDFQNKCEKEMESMKSEKIGNDVFFHDILTKNISQLAIYAKNKNIVQVLKSDDFKTKFPIYASMINSRFRKGVERKKLLEQGNTFFRSLFNRLPNECIEKISSYLSDKDLRVL